MIIHPNGGLMIHIGEILFGGGMLAVVPHLDIATLSQWALLIGSAGLFLNGLAGVINALIKLAHYVEAKLALMAKRKLKGTKK